MERIQLSMKECKKISILEKLKHGDMTQEVAAGQMRLSTRQVRRLKKKYEECGIVALAHGNRGKPSPRKLPEALKHEVVRLIQVYYGDFGPTLASEILFERHRINLHKEVLRRIMLEAGIWQKRKRRAKHRSWRKPKDRFGEFIQMDPSYHDWFEGRAPWAHLIAFIDDATKTILHAEFATSESYVCIARATIAYFQNYGLPAELYTDKGKVFRVNLNNPDHEFLTQYERALGILGVPLTHAHSPQAKGRVERGFGMHQDRLCKMLRINGISNIDAANRYLKEVYIPKLNAKFSRPAMLEGDLHVKLTDQNLDDIFCLQEERTVRNDWTIQYKNKILQIEDQRPAIVKPKDRVIVHERLNGSIFISIRSSKLEFKQVDERPTVEREPLPIRKPFKPTKNHPWRTFNSLTNKQVTTGHFHCAKQADIFTVP